MKNKDILFATLCCLYTCTYFDTFNLLFNLFCAVVSWPWYRFQNRQTSLAKNTDHIICSPCNLIWILKSLHMENVRIDLSWIANVLSCLKTWIISCFSDNWKSNFSHLKAITKLEGSDIEQTRFTKRLQQKDIFRLIWKSIQRWLFLIVKTSCSEIIHFCLALLEILGQNFDHFGLNFYSFGQNLKYFGQKL